jgi:hypothetical protein
LGRLLQHSGRIACIAAALLLCLIGAPDASAALTEDGTEVLTVPPQTPVDGLTVFVPGQTYQVTVSGQITATDNSYTFDPFYYRSHSSAPDPFPALYARFSGSSDLPSHFTSVYGDTAIPAFNEGHVYPLTFDCCFPEGRITWFAMENWGPDLTGAFQVVIDPVECPAATAFASQDGTSTCEPPPTVKFSFAQENLDIEVGAGKHVIDLISSATSGKGTLTLENQVQLRDIGTQLQGGADAVIKGSRDTITIRHTDKQAGGGDARIRMEMDEARYGIVVRPKVVYESIVFKGTVSKSDDKDCEVGRSARVTIAEPKGKGGKGGVVTVDIGKCTFHHHKFTERLNDDRVLVRVEGPTPKPPPSG